MAVCDRNRKNLLRQLQEEEVKKTKLFGLFYQPTPGLHASWGFRMVTTRKPIGGHFWFSSHSIKWATVVYFRRRKGTRTRLSYSDRSCSGAYPSLSPSQRYSKAGYSQTLLHDVGRQPPRGLNPASSLKASPVGS
jgi:hypothetical protein